MPILLRLAVRDNQLLVVVQSRIPDLRRDPNVSLYVVPIPVPKIVAGTL